MMTSRRSVLLAFGAALAAFAATHLLPTPASVHELMATVGGQPILDLKPSFSAQEVYRRLDAFGEAGRTIYRRMVWTTDVLFPAAVFMFLFLLARRTAQQLAPAPLLRALLVGLPVAYFAADMAENALIFIMLSDFPGRHDVIGNTVGHVTVVKRIAQAGALILPIVLYFARELRELGVVPADGPQE